MSDQLSNKHVGQPVDRVEGYAKVTGQAKYAAEYQADGLLFGFVVSSSITRGKITSINTEKAKAVTGVVEVITHENRPSIAWFNYKYKDQDAAPGEHFKALSDEKILYSGQPIALVVAETFEQARHAATLVDVRYEVEKHETDLRNVLKLAYEPHEKKSGFKKPPSRGHADEALEKSFHKVAVEYQTPIEHHNPMEMFASTVMRADDGSLVIYDKTQGTVNSQEYVCKVFGLDKEKVRVKTPYMGGGFGSGLRPQYQLYLAVMASIKLERSVRVVLTRQQMFSFGHRPAGIQNLELGCNEKGELQAISHKLVAETSHFEDYTENTVNWAGMLYNCKNVQLEHKISKLDSFTPMDMRAPGAASGVFALEAAMDELAYASKIDPLELRLTNYVDKDQTHYGRPFSSKELRQCYLQGADKFGWSKRKMEPRSMKEGKKLIGWGMATGMWDAFHQKGAAEAEFTKDGKLKVTSAVTDIGTGTYTIMTQIAAETLGLELNDVKVEIGDTDLPPAPLQGGSWTASTLGTATQHACKAVGESIFNLAKDLPDSPFAKAKFADVEFRDRKIVLKDDPTKALALAKILELSKTECVKEKGSTMPNPLTQLTFAKNTHSAIFAEVKVDEDYGMVEVTRVVAAIAAGRILNPKTARSQILGGVVWGISMALHEESVMDHNLGRIMNHNFAEYHIPVNKDIHDIEVIFVKEEDTIASPIGVKGLGEIGIVGTAAAVANAVYHATGKRVRELPIQLDDLLS